MLFVSSDRFPPFRVDVKVLFGKEIVGRAHVIDWLLQSDKKVRCGYQTVWSGCKVLVGRTDNGTSIINRAKKHFYSIRHDFKMFSLERKNNYNFILVRDKIISALMGILASRIHKTKFAYWLSFPIPEFYIYEFNEGTARYPLIYWIRGHLSRLLLYRIVMPYSDHVFVQSEQMKRDIALQGIQKEKMTPVPMGVEIGEIHFLGYCIKENSTQNERIVLYLGTLIRTRKIDFLIRVFEKVLRKYPGAKLYLVGSGDDTSDEKLLEDEVRRLGIIGAVKITGFLPQQEAWAYVRDADVCVSPFYPTQILNSTSPTKLIEYMAMGKATVANDHPEQKAVISESKAGICVPYDENAFAEAILYLLNHPVEAKQMGIRGRQYVEKHRSYDKIADLVEKKLLEICDKH